MTKVIACKCSYPYQDKAYGKGNRIHNYAEGKDNWRCTVCGNEKPAGLRSTIRRK